MPKLPSWAGCYPGSWTRARIRARLPGTDDVKTAAKTKTKRTACKHIVVNEQGRAMIYDPGFDSLSGVRRKVKELEQPVQPNTLKGNLL